jgi:hypothetical protein
MKIFIKQNTNLIPARTEETFGRKIGLMAALFGCWHKNLSRPFSDGKNSYRVCLQCGARKNFNAETLTTSPGFYYPPKPSAN